VLGEGGVQVAQVGAGLRAGDAPLGVDLVDPVHVPGKIEDDRLVDRLAGEAGPAPAREHRHVPVGTQRDGGCHVRGRLREDDPDRRHLVGAGVGRVQLAGVLVEAHLAVDAPLERCDEVGARLGTALVVVAGSGVRCRVDPGTCPRVVDTHIISFGPARNNPSPPAASQQEARTLCSGYASSTPASGAFCLTLSMPCLAFCLEA
jgi:hypothetical protein